MKVKHGYKKRVVIGGEEDDQGQSSSEMRQFIPHYDSDSTTGSEGTEDEEVIVKKPSYVSPKRQPSSPTGRMKIFFALVFICLLLINVLVIFIIWHHLKRSHNDQSCVGVSCVVTSAGVLTKMDLTSDPCSDFYQYSCGGFLADLYVPPDKTKWSMFSQVGQRNKHALLKMLQKKGGEYNGRNSSAIQKARDHFTACMNTSLLEQKGTEPVLKLIHTCGSWPLTDDPVSGTWNEGGRWRLEAALAAAMRHDAAPLLSVGVTTDMKDSNNSVLAFDQAGLTLPSPKFYTNKSHTLFLEFFVEAATLLGSKVNVEKMAESVWQLEAKLAKKFTPNDQRGRSDKLYHKMSLAQLQLTMPGIRLSLLLHELFGQVIPDTQQVVVYSPDYLHEMALIVKETPPETLATYILWHVVSGLADYLPERFQKVSFKMSAALYGVSAMPERWNFCVEDAELVLGFATGALYVQERFSAEDKKRALSILDRVHLSVQSRLPNLKWMDAATKQAASVKAKAIKQFIGYPDYISDVDKLDEHYKTLTIDRNDLFQNVINYLVYTTRKNLAKLDKPPDKMEWDMIPASVNAYYSVSTNKIVFPAGILQRPFYDAQFPMSMNFGSIGMVMGHELTHAFDNNGRLFNSAGNLDNWWTNRSAVNFHDHAQCLVRQYNEYRIQGKRMNSKLTLGENIADIGGLRVAYDAYTRWSKHNPDDGGSQSLLPALNMTNKQLFFLAFAQTWCAYYTPEYALVALDTDVHSPSKYRVIGTLSNMAEFSNAFSCPRHSEMNRGDDHCSIW